MSAAGRKSIARWARLKASAFVARLRAEAEARAMKRTGKGRPSGRAKDRQKAAEEQAAFLIARAIKRRGLRAREVWGVVRRNLRTFGPAIVARVFGRFRR